MSYNITAWKIRHIHLELPLTFNFQEWLREQPDFTERGYENVGKRWCLEDRDSLVRCSLADGTWNLCASGHDLSGIIQGDTLLMSDPKALDWTGDGSGHLYSDILIPLFKAFQGDLNALVVWEGGDSIRQLAIASGIVSDKEIQ
jgi:hypothetical protein